MRVAYLTAGAAGMYCGSCLRDNTLVAALRAQGRDVLLAPLYTPIRTDEPDVSEHRVLYGGINVYLQQRSRLFRHTPWALDRLLDSPELLRRVSRGADGTPGQDVAELLVSTLRGQQGAQRKELAKLVRWLADARVDLVNLPNAMFVGTAATIRRELGVPVLCTLTGEDLFLDSVPEPWRTQAIELIRAGAAHVDGFVAVSRYYAGHAGRYFGISADKLVVVPLGVRVQDHAPVAAPASEPFTIGYMARICPEKGLHVLCEAVDLLRRQGRACRLRAAGYLSTSNRPYLDRLADGHGSGASRSFEYLGEVDRAGKLNLLRSLHVLSVPSVYREAKGLYVLEALAAGVPVVQPNHGAFPEVIEATGGGLLVEPESPAALAHGLAELMDDPVLRQKLGQRGRAAVHEAHTDQIMAQRMWSLYEQYATSRRR